jgi:methionyl aminopeptidase
MITYKTPEEIEILREGGKRHHFILEELAKMVEVGVSTNDLENKARELVLEQGDKSAFFNYKPYGAKRPYPAYICVSINDEIVHGIPNENPKIFKEGDVVSIDLGLTHKGLITDSAVTVLLGKDEIKRKLIEHTKEALYAGIKQAKIGNKVSDISKAIQEIGQKFKYGICEGLSGHGVGYKVHEDPYVPNEVLSGKSDILKEGMVLAIEPMFTLGSSKIALKEDGYTYRTKDLSIACHFEHTIAITKEGPIILTKS